MTSKEKLINQILDGFQEKRGVASCYCFSKTIIPELITQIVEKFAIKHPDTTILIVVDTYYDREQLKKATTTPTIYNSGCKVTIVTKNYVPNSLYTRNLSICVGINDDYEFLEKLKKESYFMLAILTRNIMNNTFINNVRAILPSIITDDLNAAIRRDSIYAPIEEIRHGVDLSPDDRKLYDEYSNYISTSVSIFGDLSVIEKCKNGDKALGMSAAEYRNMIATNNGWNEHLDTTNPVMRQIDDVYNPNVLYERARVFYTIAAKRRELVETCESKLEIIKDICLKNSGKKIIIVSKSGTFAAKITKYINKNTNLKCRDYHDCIEDTEALDSWGNPILIKSGPHKGEPKIIGAQAQSTINEKSFTYGAVNILSMKSASNSGIKTICDLIIFTSALCDSITDFKTRFSNITFNGTPFQTFKIYCNNTIELRKLDTKNQNGNINIIDETSNDVIFDEKSGDVIL